MALHGTPTILERALQALQEYERTRGQTDASAVLPFGQPAATNSVDAPPGCPVHGASATWWNRKDGSAVCGRCHPDTFDTVGSVAAQSEPLDMPAGVRLLRWEPKLPPIAVTTFSVVTDPQKFIEGTLQQLEAALRGNVTAAGNLSVRDLCERLEQVGIRVAVAQKG